MTACAMKVNLASVVKTTMVISSSNFDVLKVKIGLSDKTIVFLLS